MDQQGRLTQWNDARGFGFITPQAKGPRIFVHISQFQERNRRPSLNELLTYTIGQDEQGRLRAKEVRYQQHSKPEPVSKHSFWAAFPVKVALFILLGLIAIYFRLDGVSISKLFDMSFDKLFDQSFESRTARVDKAGLNTYQAPQNGAQMGGEGLVERVLADDNDGSRHQRFIIRLASGQTLLIAHNIDIANRIEALRIGDRVQFYGQYESNPQGGVIHWTHHDPDGNHVAGWLKHNGMVYQ